MSIHLLAVGCDYRGETCELPDCARDAAALTEALEPYIASGRELTNSKATRSGMLKALRVIKATAKQRDLVILSFSGHGVTDMIGGKPQQGIVSNDLQIIYEFELRELLAEFGQAVFIADCCYAGGLLRGPGKARCVPASYCFRWDVDPPRRMAKKPHATFLACKPGETAASTGHGGAFTLALLEAFAATGERSRFIDLHKAIRKILPNAEHKQTPQFSCADKEFAGRTLRSFNRRWNVKAGA